MGSEFRQSNDARVFLVQLVCDNAILCLANRRKDERLALKWRSIQASSLAQNFTLFGFKSFLTHNTIAYHKNIDTHKRQVYA